MIQELIASMLGVRREGVTEAAGKQQKSRVIQYNVGRLHCWIGRGWSSSRVSVMPWSRQNQPPVTRALDARERPVIGNFQSTLD
jgi:hypothetical protein